MLLPELKIVHPGAGCSFTNAIILRNVFFHPARSGKPIFQDGKYNHSKEVTKGTKLT